LTKISQDGVFIIMLAIDLGFWDECAEAMNVFTKKMGKKEKEE